MKTLAAVIALLLSGCVSIGYHQSKLDESEALYNECQIGRYDAIREADNCLQAMQDGRVRREGRDNER